MAAKRGNDELLGLLMNGPSVVEQAGRAARLIKPTTEQKYTYPTTKGELAYPGDSITPGKPRMAKPKAPPPAPKPPPGTSGSVRAITDRKLQQRQVGKEVGYRR